MTSHQLWTIFAPLTFLHLVWYFAEFCCSPEGKAAAGKHQDIMVKAFEHLIRRNRENNPLEDCARVIGNAMNVLAEIHDFKSKADESFFDINKKYPAVVPGLIVEILDPVAVH